MFLCVTSSTITLAIARDLIISKYQYSNSIAVVRPKRLISSVQKKHKIAISDWEKY